MTDIGREKEQKTDLGFVMYFRFIMYFGFINMVVMTILVALWPQPELLPNSILSLNIWTIYGLIAYLVCWPVAFHQLLCQRNIGGMIGLDMVSVLFFAFFLIYSYNPFAISVIFMIIFVFLLYVEAPNSYFRKYYTTQER